MEQGLAKPVAHFFSGLLAASAAWLRKGSVFNTLVVEKPPGRLSRSGRIRPPIQQRRTAAVRIDELMYSFTKGKKTLLQPKIQPRKLDSIPKTLAQSQRCVDTDDFGPTPARFITDSAINLIL